MCPFRYLRAHSIFDDEMMVYDEDEADHLRHREENKRIYAQRKETIGRVFADLKEKHGMRWTTLRGLKRMSVQAMLVFAAMNFKKMATWLWKTGRTSPEFSFVFVNMDKKRKELPRLQYFAGVCLRSGRSWFPAPPCCVLLNFIPAYHLVQRLRHLIQLLRVLQQCAHIEQLLIRELHQLRGMLRVLFGDVRNLIHGSKHFLGAGGHFFRHGRRVLNLACNIRNVR
ncbi:transposase [Paenibacillus dendritiformis C454]|uniref:Transposase n=1 Tax=Paenibacillus dendritiformis C454 TaxID=1131935 RepID=H3SL85_9BACL|nr:transposase [Paenibacillus dendritiformis C454]